MPSRADFCYKIDEQKLAQFSSLATNKCAAVSRLDCSRIISWISVGHLWSTSHNPIVIVNQILRKRDENRGLMAIWISSFVIRRRLFSQQETLIRFRYWPKNTSSFSFPPPPTFWLTSRLLMMVVNCVRRDCWTLYNRMGSGDKLWAFPWFIGFSSASLSLDWN